MEVHRSSAARPAMAVLGGDRQRNTTSPATTSWWRGRRCDHVHAWRWVDWWSLTWEEEGSGFGWLKGWSSTMSWRWQGWYSTGVVSRQIANLVENDRDLDSGSLVAGMIPVVGFAWRRMATEGRHGGGEGGGANGCGCRLGQQGPWWRCSRQFHGSVSGKDVWCWTMTRGGNEAGCCWLSALMGETVATVVPWWRIMDSCCDLFFFW